MNVSPWSEVCGEGSDPRLVEALVARLAAGRGSAQRMAKAAASLSITEGHGGRELLRRLAGRPSRTAREAVAEVAVTWARLGVQVALAGDPRYPRRLMRWWPTDGAPPLIAWRGAAIPDRPTAAIIGARRVTPYGAGVAAWLAQSVAESGAHVVSGGAVGVDAAAHAAASGAAGATTAVLGCGHGVTYPRPHAAPRGLFHTIVETGGAVASELLPHERPHRGNILARNRIVAGLADVVVVVEGGATSGSLRTAQNAADLGVPVMAVPGDVRAPGSAAPHQLLSEGAAPCRGPADVLAALGTGEVPPGDVAAATAERPAPSVLPARMREELAARWPRPVRVERLAQVADVGIGGALAAITRARIAGEVAESPEGVRLRQQPG